MMEVSLLDVVNAIQVLDGLQTAQFHKSDTISFNQLCATNIQKLKEFVSSSSTLAALNDRFGFHSIDEVTGYDVRWHFVSCNVELLRLLCQTFSEPVIKCSAGQTHTLAHHSADSNNSVTSTLCSDDLSLAHRKTVSSSLQFITGLGICPLLLSGVGIPLSRRSEWSAALLKDNAIDCLSNVGHLGDLLASLIQLAHAPAWKNYAVEFTKSHCSGNVHPACRHSNYMDELTKLTNQVSSSVLVREILLLQSGCPPSAAMKVVVRPPAWLRKVCQSYLQRIISKPDGILNILVNTLQDNSVIDSRKCEAVARIVIDCCKTESTYDQHFRVLAPQILKLLHADATKGAMYRTIVGIVEGMYARRSDVTHELVTMPLLQPLLQCLRSSASELPVGSEFISEQTFTESVIIIHKVFVLNCVPQSPLLVRLSSIIHVLYQLNCVVCQSVSVLRKPVTELLERLFSSIDRKTSARYLKQLCLNEFAEFQLVDSHYQIVAGDSGGVKVVVCDETGDEKDDDWINSADNMMELLGLLQQHGDLIAEFFLLCLEELTTVVSVMPTLEELSVPSASSSQDCLLDIDARVEKMTELLKRNLSLLSIISAVCDRFGGDCLQKTDHILRFVQVTLERVVRQLDIPEESSLKTFENETLVMALGLLAALVTNNSQNEKISWDSASDLLPLLQHVAEMHPDSSVKHTAADVHILIATHGRVTINRSCERSHTKTRNSTEASYCKAAAAATASNTVASDSGTKIKPLIEIIDSTEDSVQDQHTSLSCYQAAMSEVSDALIHVRGHALLTLRRLVDSGDTETLNSVDKVLAVCDRTISDPDSYVYLNAIQLLSAVASKMPQRTLPWLADRYLAVSELQAGGGNHQQDLAERRMKLGEVLVKSSSALGPLMPHYRDLLLGTCMRACKDQEPLIRASAVSNLGQVCQNLHFALGSVMYEVFDCIQSLLKSDHDIVVRRSAAVCTTLLLRGLSKNCLKVLGGGLLHSFYKVLKHCLIVETDDVLRLQLQLASDEIDIFMKDFWSPTETLTKRIHVLDPLDVD